MLEFGDIQYELHMAVIHTAPTHPAILELYMPDNSKLHHKHYLLCD